MKKTSNPPTIGTTKPRNDFGPHAVLACLDILSRRQSRHTARLSSISRLRGAR